MPAKDSEDQVQYMGYMRRADRNRFRAWCVLHGLEMRDVGTQWIVDRLAQEEKKDREQEK